MADEQTPEPTQESTGPDINEAGQAELDRREAEAAAADQGPAEEQPEPGPTETVINPPRGRKSES